jgi:hypothetical protein
MLLLVLLLLEQAGAAWRSSVVQSAAEILRGGWGTG